MVNFDFPATSSLYLHRSGRTARMGTHGLVTQTPSQPNATTAQRSLQALSATVINTLSPPLQQRGWHAPCAGDITREQERDNLRGGSVQGRCRARSPACSREARADHLSGLALPSAAVSECCAPKAQPPTALTMFSLMAPRRGTVGKTPVQYHLPAVQSWADMSMICTHARPEVSSRTR